MQEDRKSVHERGGHVMVLGKSDYGTLNAAEREDMQRDSFPCGDIRFTISGPQSGRHFNMKTSRGKAEKTKTATRYAEKTAVQ